MRRWAVWSLGLLTALWWVIGGSYFSQLLGWASGTGAGWLVAMWWYRKEQDK
jgi:hypothetical protein